MNPSSPADSPSPARRRGSGLGEIVLFLLLWVAFMQPVRTLAPSLDASWQMMLGYAHDHGLQFGRDLVPTMGPAGFLITASPAIHHLTARFAWMLFGNAALALTFVWFGRSITGRLRRAAYFAFLLLLVAPFAESMQGLALLVLGLSLLQPGLGGRLGLTAAIALALGALSLFKVTHLTLAAVLVAGAVVHAARRDGLVRAGIILVGFVAGFAVGWKVLGQSWDNLPDFLRLSAEVSRGYVDAMSLYESAGLFWWGLGTLAACALCAGIYWRGAADQFRASITVIVLAAAWFLNWKHGFVRADGHTLTLFLVCGFTGLAFTALGPGSDTPRLRRWSTVTVLLGLGGIWSGYAPALTDAFGSGRNRLRENFALLAELRHPPQFAARLRSEFTQFGHDRLLPRVTALVESNPLDVFGAEQAIAMFDNFHYTPRPVFQDYYAYTSRLGRLNEAFYASSRAPRFVLQKYETIDGRLPGLDDARTRAMVFTHYALIAEENGWLLWEKRTAPRPLTPSLLEKSTVTFDQVIPVPATTDGAMWAQIAVQPSWLGRLRALLYKPPQLTLQVTDRAGATQSYRLVSAMAADGFLIRPFFPTQAAITRYFSGLDPAAIGTLKVTIPEGDRAYFASDISVSFSRVADLPRDPPENRPAGDPRFRMFSLAPSKVESPHPAGPYLLDGHETFFIHAPGRMEFAPDIAITHLRGSVGLPPDTYTGPNPTDGVEIVIEHLSPTGRQTTLYHRLLDPAHVPADRGLQPFYLTLPGKGRVVLRNLTGPKDNNTFDWTLWSDLSFE